jgi:hypothetical protein
LTDREIIGIPFQVVRRAMGNPFTDHPHEAGQTFGEHWAFAMSVALQAGAAGLAAAVHAFLPFAFKSTASRILRALDERMAAARRES